MNGLRRRGVALMLVLWLMVVLGVIATAVATASHGETTLVSNLRARVTARYAAESGVALATGRLERLLAEAARPDLDRDFTALREVPFGDARFGVVVVDLNARLDLNRSDPQTLLAFFSQFTDRGRAERVVAALEDWKDADDRPRPRGAEAREYAAARSPFVPRNAPLDRLDDFAHLLGAGDSLAFAVAPFVTVDGDGLVNVNSAPEPVLAALPGIGVAEARALVARRAGGETLTTTTIPHGVVAPTRLLIVSRGWLGGHPLTHEIQAVYGVAGSRLYLLAWRERDL